MNQDTTTPLSRDDIREVFLANGFKVKEGQADLKGYVYAAADALLKRAGHPPAIDYEAIEREHLGDAELQTGIYARDLTAAEVDLLRQQVEQFLSHDRRDKAFWKWAKTTGKLPVRVRIGGQKPNSATSDAMAPAGFVVGTVNSDLGRTGWAPGMLQDDSRELSRALAGKPDAPLHAREAAAAIEPRTLTPDEAHLKEQTYQMLIAGYEVDERVQLIFEELASEPGGPMHATEIAAAITPADEEPSCPECDGSGEVTAMTSHLGPDDYEFQDTCPHCGGTGTLADAYAGVVKLLEAKNKEYQKVSGQLWGACHVREVAAWRWRENGDGSWSYSDDRDVLLARPRDAETQCLYPPLEWKELNGLACGPAVPAHIEFMTKWFDAFTKDRCDCFFERSLIAQWISDLCAGRAYRPGPGADVSAAMEQLALHPGPIEMAEPTTTCRKCGGGMFPGQAFVSTLVRGMPDFPGDEARSAEIQRGETLSFDGPGQLVDCLKCVACGHSVTTGADQHGE